MTDEHDTDDKNPVEQAMELFVYAPLGFALEAHKLLPQLVERGRQQMTLARMIGQFAVQQGQTEATKVLGKAGEQANTVLTDLGFFGRSAPSPRPPSPRPEASNGRLPASSASSDATAPPTPTAPRSGAEAVDLAVADYDSLAASQVIPRLPGLTADEMEAVRVYEAGHRGRKTILNRIAQLQSA